MFVRRTVLRLRAGVRLARLLLIPVLLVLILALLALIRLFLLALVFFAQPRILLLQALVRLFLQAPVRIVGVVAEVACPVAGIGLLDVAELAAIELAREDGLQDDPLGRPLQLEAAQAPLRRSLAWPKP